MERRNPGTSLRLRALALVALLCAAVIGGSASPVAAGSPAGGSHQMTVMTRNLYLGADLLPVVAAQNPTQLAVAAAAVYSMVQATDFPSRAKALAREIDNNDPALVGLQEVSLWRKGEMALLDGPVTPADIVVYDFLELLMDRLAARGLDYSVVVKQSTFDAEVPTALGHDIRLTQRNVILARSDLPPGHLKLSNAQASHFDNNNVFPTLAGPLTDTRGWVSVDVFSRGRSFRFINTHLDSYDPGIRALQAGELLDGPADVDQPVVLVGDLNAEPSQPTIELLLDGGLRDAWVLARNTPGYTCCNAEDLRNPSPTLDRRIDYVRVSRGLDARKAHLVGNKPRQRVSGLWPSDHAGVVATLGL
jgi:endonuclease/exonuclease/phosphatase family metal-dependent hydrolase